MVHVQLQLKIFNNINYFDGTGVGIGIIFSVFLFFSSAYLLHKQFNNNYDLFYFFVSFLSSILLLASIVFINYYYNFHQDNQLIFQFEGIIIFFRRLTNAYRFAKFGYKNPNNHIPTEPKNNENQSPNFKLKSFETEIVKESEKIKTTLEKKIIKDSNGNIIKNVQVNKTMTKEPTEKIKINTIYEKTIK
jgi:hypothetical protein